MTGIEERLHKDEQVLSDCLAGILMLRSIFAQSTVLTTPCFGDC